MSTLTREVGNGGRQHRGSGHGDPPGPRPACPSAGWGGSDRTPLSLVWGYRLETTVLEKAAERKIIFVQNCLYFACSATVDTVSLLITITAQFLL